MQHFCLIEARFINFRDENLHENLIISILFEYSKTSLLGTSTDSIKVHFHSEADVFRVCYWEPIGTLEYEDPIGFQ